MVLGPHLDDALSIQSSYQNLNKIREILPYISAECHHNHVHC